MKRFLFFIITIIATAGIINAQIKFTAKAPRIVETNEQFRLEYKVNAQGGQFVAPNLSHFQKMGPHTSTMMSSSYVNGKMAQQISSTYTYVMLTDKPGKYTISPAKIKIKGKVYTSNKVEIEVVGEKKVNNRGVKASGDLFVRIIPNKKTVYKNEHLIVTLKLYTVYNRLGFEDFKNPSYNGFTSGEIEIPNTSHFKQEKINGKTYNVKVLKKQILYPQQSGELKIAPAEITINAEIPTGRYTIWGPETKRIQKKVKSNAPVIKVKELPADPPASFNGAVGNFTMSATIDKDNVKAYDAITFKVVFQGIGNFKTLSSLDLDLPNDFEIFPPKLSDNYVNSIKGTTGSKSFEYVLRPRFPGNYELNPIEFTYFDISSKKYKTIKPKTFKINVEKGDGTESTTFVSSVNQEELRVLGSDIEFIRINDFQFIKKGTILFGTLPFNLSYIVPMSLFLLFFVIRRKQIKERANVLLMKNKQANKVSRKRLKQAEKHLKANETKEFNSEISKALWGYLSDKLNIPVSELSRQSAREHLENKKIAEDVIVQFLAVIDTSEFAQFAPSQDEGASEKAYKEASQIINKFEQKLK